MSQQDLKVPTPPILPQVTMSSLLQTMQTTMTLEGQNTFHGMGIIAAVTPGTKRQIYVPRCSATAVDVVAAAKMVIHFYKNHQNHR